MATKQFGSLDEAKLELWKQELSLQSSIAQADAIYKKSLIEIEVSKMQMQIKSEFEEANKTQINPIVLKYKFEIGDWVRLKPIWWPFSSTSFGKITDRKQVPVHALFWVYTREFYEIESWYNGRGFTFPVQRLELDKPLLLEHKIALGEQNDSA